MSQSVMQCGARQLDLSAPQVMGVLNVTPDSFSDGGRLRQGDESAVFFVSVESALREAERMLAEGAAIIDVGGESTRPGADPVSLQEEMDRVVPVVQAISERLDVCLSVDSSKPELIRAAGEAGAGIVNDVRALQLDGALKAAADSSMGVCLMHMQGNPDRMQAEPRYDDVCAEVYTFLQQRVDAALDAGISRQRLMIDPGFGFGKNRQHNYQLLARLADFGALELPVLVGMSRKSMIGAVVDRPVQERLAGSLAAAVCAVLNGARIVRSHDVAATVDALRVCSAVIAERNGK